MLPHLRAFVPHQAATVEPALPGHQWRPLEGLRPDTNGVPFVPAEESSLWLDAACKAGGAGRGWSQLLIL